VTLAFRTVRSPSTPPPRSEGLSEGQTLAGKYLLVRKLGEGGMCAVFEAEHVHLGQAVAVKALKPELARDRDCVARFEREARAAAQLRSPNVARVHDVDWTPEGLPYITMELLRGHDLGAELKDGVPLPIEIAVDYIRQAAGGIAEAHALGIVHRDLKPENLFLTELGELTDRKLVKILDFGIAKDIADSARRLTAPDAVFGTVDYMSPEQIRSASTVDHRTDLWSLGVILYELLTGRLPFSGDARSIIAQIVSDPVPPPSRFAAHLPPSLVGVVMKALQKDPALRFPSAEALRTALEGFGELEPITSVLAALPPQSMPRRALGSVPFENLRDVRTNASWETAAPRRGWSKRWLVLPFTAACVVSAATVLLEMRGENVTDYYRAIAGGRWAPEPSLAAPPRGPSEPEELTSVEPDEPGPVAAPAADEVFVDAAPPPTAEVEPKVATPRAKPRAKPPSPKAPAPAPPLPRHL
jgi:eukaryotic-like serine/threonine-protein kinase